MKWTNKGQQFDEVAKIICDANTEYYLWGAGETGENFIKRNKEKFKIKGIIDSNKELWGNRIDDVEIVSPEVLDIDKDAKVIITILTPKCLDEVNDILESKNLFLNVDFFWYTFIERIVDFYHYNKLSLMQFDLMLIDKCTLSCDKCLLKIPHLKKTESKDLEKVKSEIESIFQCIDIIGDFHLVGGEVLLYSELDKVVEFLGKNYRNRIETLTIVSNATIIPKLELIKIMKKYNVKFIISDYSQSEQFNKKQNVNQIIELLNHNNIPVEVRNQKEWNDYDSDITKKSTITQEMLFSCYLTCPCVGKTFTIENGKFYLCCREAAAVHGNLYSENENDYICVEEGKINKKKLMEFSLGCTNLGYLTYCKFCCGEIPIYERVIPAAKQLR